MTKIVLYLVDDLSMYFLNKTAINDDLFHIALDLWGFV